VKAAITWFIDNPIAANLLLVLIFLLGCFGIFNIQTELFPDIKGDVVNIEVSYPGANPEAVELRLVAPIESILSDQIGVKKYSANAFEGGAYFSAQIKSGFNIERITTDIRTKIDGANDLPQLEEKPRVSISDSKEPVMTIAVSGKAPYRTLMSTAAIVREELGNLKGVGNVVTVAGLKDEITIEILPVELQRYNLSFDDLADAVKNSSKNFPAGVLKTKNEEIQIRTGVEYVNISDLENTVIYSDSIGGELRLSDVAVVKYSLSDANNTTHLNGENAFFLQLYISKNPNILSLSDSVNDYIRYKRNELSANVDLSVVTDNSVGFKSRMSLLGDNALSGILFVFLILFIFLELRVAFWVCIGILTSFVGAAACLAAFGISINMISMFSFMLVVGIIVDDSIIVGESISLSQKKNNGVTNGTKAGILAVYKPVLIAVFSTMLFFSPLLFVPGEIGELAYSIPVVIILCLTFSIIESFFILPSHLNSPESLKKVDNDIRLFKTIGTLKSKVANYLVIFSAKYYRTFLIKTLKYRGSTIALFVCLFLVSISLVNSGRLNISFMPIVPADSIRLFAELPEGTSSVRVKQLHKNIKNTIYDLKNDSLLSKNNSRKKYIENSITWTSDTSVFAIVSLTSADNRDLTAADIGRRWRQIIGTLPELTKLEIDDSLNSQKDEIILLLNTYDENYAESSVVVSMIEKLIVQQIGKEIVNNTFNPKRTSISVSINSKGRLLGLTQKEIAQQVRHVFQGEKIFRLTHQDEEIPVLLKYSTDESKNMQTMNEMLIHTRNDLNELVEISLNEVADFSFVPGYSNIERIDGKRVYEISIAIDEYTSDVEEALEMVLYKFEDSIADKYPNYSLTIDDGEADESKFIIHLIKGFIVVMFIIFALLAIIFKSYLQPIIVLIAVPMGFVGAILGHLLLGQELSIISVLGIVACAGVVLNDNIVLLDKINRLISSGVGVENAIVQSAVFRFRPIFLTSITTFVGLIPMLLENGEQAAYLIPMAISLAFGVLLATTVTLVLVPSLVLISLDLKSKVKAITESNYLTE